MAAKFPASTEKCAVCGGEAEYNNYCLECLEVARELDEDPETLEATARMLEGLEDGSFYKKQEDAVEWLRNRRKS